MHSYTHPVNHQSLWLNRSFSGQVIKAVCHLLLITWLLTLRLLVRISLRTDSKYMQRLLQCIHEYIACFQPRDNPYTYDSGHNSNVYANNDCHMQSAVAVRIAAYDSTPTTSGDKHKKLNIFKFFIQTKCNKYVK